MELHKLAAFQLKSLRNTAFDIEERYRRLLAFYQSNKGAGFVENAEWVTQILDTFFGGTASPEKVPSLCLATYSIKLFIAGGRWQNNGEQSRINTAKRLQERIGKEEAYHCRKLGGTPRAGWNEAGSHGEKEEEARIQR